MKQNNVTTKSTISRYGNSCTQIIHFVGGEKRTFYGLKTDNIKQGQFTKLENVDGNIIMINDKNVLCVEVIFEGVPSLPGHAECWLSNKFEGEK